MYTYVLKVYLDLYLSIIDLHMDYKKLYKLSTTFTPSAPINNKDLFAGRKEQVFTAISTIGQVGQHAIMFGERGVGKTSLTNVIQDFLPSGDSAYSLRINCSTRTTFVSLWKDILRQIHLKIVTQGTGFT